MEEFKISEPNDLAKVDVDEQIDIKGAKNFIRRWYDGSIVQALQRLYPLAKIDEEFFKKEAEERAKIPKVKGSIFLNIQLNMQELAERNQLLLHLHLQLLFTQAIYLLLFSLQKKNILKAILQVQKIK